MSRLRTNATPTPLDHNAAVIPSAYASDDLACTLGWSGMPGDPTRQMGIVGKRQLQITTTITPTITRGVAQPTALPTRTEPRLPGGASSTPAAGKEGDSSLFPANLSWWQVLGIALGGVAVVGIVIYMFISRGKKKRAAAQKAKELEIEEGKKRKESDDAPRGLPLGMGMGMGGLGMGMGGMGMGMGGMPMVYGQGQGVGNGKGKSGGRGRRRYSDLEDDWSSSGTESYDDFSDGGTIRRSKRRRPRRRKERHRGKGRRRKEDNYSDGSLSSATDSTYHARPRKDRGRREPIKQERRQPSRKTPATASTRSTNDDMPLGLGPPTTALRTGSSGSPLSRKKSKTDKFRDSVFSTFESMRDKAIRLKQVEQSLKLKEDLMREERAEAERLRQRQITMRIANDQLRKEKADEERARQNIIDLYQTPQPQYQQTTLRSDTPLIPPVPRSRSRDDSPLHRDRDRDRQSSRSRGKNQLLGERLAVPASAYNSALPQNQNQSQKHLGVATHGSSDLPYAYDGVTSMVSSQPPPPEIPPVPSSHNPARSTSDSRKKSSRRVKPPMHRQDSDIPLKSAMRVPGDRKPRRKATITEKPPTTRMITDDAAYKSDGQSDWLPKPPAFRPPPSRKASANSGRSNTGSMTLDIPLPKDRPIIKPGGLAPAPPRRAKMKPRVETSENIPRSMGSIDDGGAGGAGGGDETKPGWGQWLGWKPSGGMGTVEVTIPPAKISPRAASPDSIYAIPRPAIARTATPPSDPHEPGKRWANRLRERR